MSIFLLCLDNGESIVKLIDHFRVIILILRKDHSLFPISNMKDVDQQRRDFIKKGFAVGALFSLVDLGGLFAAEEKTKTAESKKEEEKKSVPDLVAVRGGERVAMLDKALAVLGGIERFVKKGQTVVLKPNAGWDKSPQLAANTHPDLVGRMVELCLKAGAKEVNVFDHTCNDWQKSYANSGIREAVEKAGGKMVPGNDKSMYVEKEVPGAKVLKKAQIHKLIAESDVYINMPVLKHHGGATMTACLKNVMGIVLDRKFFHEKGLHECIVDGLLYRKPDLNILDAYAPMMRNGPQGKSENDLMDNVKSLIVSVDPVACDAAGQAILGHKKGDIKHVALAAEAGYGVDDLSKLKVERIVMA